MSFTAVITANVSDFEKGIQEAQKSVNGLEKNVSTSLQDVGNSFVKVGKAASVFSAAVAAAAVGVYAFTKSTADMANNLLSATIALDSSSDLLQQYKLIGIEAGTSTEAFAGAVEALTKRLKEAGEEGDNTSELMAMLGVSFNDATGNMRRTGDITDDLIKSLASMENVSQRNVIASQLFGRRWAEIAPILGLGADGIERVKKEAYEMGVVLDTDALNAANNFSIATNKLTLQLQAMKDSLASELAPVLQATFGTLVEGKLMPAIKAFTKSLGELATQFNELPEGAKNTILAVTGLAIAIGPLLLAIGGLIKLIPILVAGFAAVKIALIAMTGPIGLTIIGITALTVGIIALTKRFSEVTTSSQAYASVNNIVIKSISEEIAKLNSLLKVAKDDKESKKNRLSAIQQLNIISPEYLGNLTLENIGTINAKKSVEDYTKALRENAREKAVGAKLTELQTKLIKEQAKLIEIDENPKFENDDVLTRSARADAMIGPLNRIMEIQKQISLYEKLSTVKTKAETVTPTTTTNPEVDALLAKIKALEDALANTNKEKNKLKDTDTFTKLIGDGSNLNEIVAKTVEQIQLMNARLEGLQNGTIKVKNVKQEIESTEKSVKDLTSAFETLTGKSGSWATASLGALETPKLGFGDGGLIPAPTFDLEAASKTLTDLGNFKEAVATNFIELGNLAASGLGAFADAIGNALGSGNFDDLGSELISALGSLAQQFGGMLISFGLAATQLQLLITNPVAAIAAGVALVALGAAAKASASKMVSNATSGGNYSAGGTSSYQTATTLGSSDYRGQYQDDYTVNFKIGSNELVGVLEMANQRKKRL